MSLVSDNSWKTIATNVNVQPNIAKFRMSILSLPYWMLNSDELHVWEQICNSAERTQLVSFIEMTIMSDFASYAIRLVYIDQVIGFIKCPREDFKDMLTANIEQLIWNLINKAHKNHVFSSLPDMNRMLDRVAYNNRD